MPYAVYLATGGLALCSLPNYTTLLHGIYIYKRFSSQEATNIAGGLALDFGGL
jgi:hypothetical protein